MTYEDGFIRPEIGYLIIGKLENKEEKEKELEKEKLNKKRMFYK